MYCNTPFKIEIRFGKGLSDTQKQIFSLAAQRWSEIIIADVPKVTVEGVGEVDDLVIDASGVQIDGAGHILGRAGPTWIRQGSFIPAHGIMEFDSADLNRMEQNGSLLNVIIHEMGHVLGLGTLWEVRGFIEGIGSDNPLYIGPNGMREYASLIGTSSPQKVPLANTGEPGTREGHWREKTFVNELMTGFINNGIANPLSCLSIAALQDLGYQVNYQAADAYQLSSLFAREVGDLLGGELCQSEAVQCQVLSKTSVR